MSASATCGDECIPTSSRSAGLAAVRTTRCGHSSQQPLAVVIDAGDLHWYAHPLVIGVIAFSFENMSLLPPVMGHR